MPLSQWPLAGDTGLWGVTGLARPHCYAPWRSTRSRASQKTAKFSMWSKRLVTSQDQLQSRVATLTTLFCAAACIAASAFSFVSPLSSASFSSGVCICNPVLALSLVSWHCCMRFTLYFLLHVFFFLSHSYFSGFQFVSSYSALCFELVQRGVRYMQIVHKCSSLTKSDLT